MWWARHRRRVVFRRWLIRTCLKTALNNLIGVTTIMPMYNKWAPEVWSFQTTIVRMIYFRIVKQINSKSFKRGSLLLKMKARSSKIRSWRPAKIVPMSAWQPACLLRHLKSRRRGLDDIRPMAIFWRGGCSVWWSKQTMILGKSSLPISWFVHSTWSSNRRRLIFGSSLTIF